MKKETVTEKISRRAQELFEVRGGEDGHDLDDWLQAENEILSEKKTGKRKTSKSTRTGGK